MEEGKDGRGDLAGVVRITEGAENTENAEWKVGNNQSFVIGGLAFFPHY